MSTAVLIFVKGGETEKVEYEKPEVILAKIEKLEEEITKGISELKAFESQ